MKASEKARRLAERQHRNQAQAAARTAAVLAREPDEDDVRDERLDDPARGPSPWWEDDALIAARNDAERS